MQVPLTGERCVRGGEGSFMRRFTRSVYVVALLATLAPGLAAQKPLTWDEVEARANEITAYLRPNPELNISADGTQIAPYQGVWQPLAGTDQVIGASYLHERGHKRELRLQSAKEQTDITTS